MPYTPLDLDLDSYLSRTELQGCWDHLCIDALARSMFMRMVVMDVGPEEDQLRDTVIKGDTKRYVLKRGCAKGECGPRDQKQKNCRESDFIRESGGTERPKVRSGGEWV